MNQNVKIHFFFLVIFHCSRFHLHLALPAPRKRRVLIVEFLTLLLKIFQTLLKKGRKKKHRSEKQGKKEALHLLIK